MFGSAVANTSDIPFLDWIYERFSDLTQRAVREKDLKYLARLYKRIAVAMADENSAVAVAEYLLARQYAFPPSLIRVAAAAQNLPFVRFLLGHSASATRGCTTHTLSIAAMTGKLSVVRFPQEHNAIACTSTALTSALTNGHIDVLSYLYEHRSENCGNWAVDDAAAQVVTTSTLHLRTHTTLLASLSRQCREL